MRMWLLKQASSLYKYLIVLTVDYLMSILWFTPDVSLKSCLLQFNWQSLKCAIEVVQRHANNVIKYSMLEKLIINLNSFHQKHGIGNSWSHPLFTIYWVINQNCVSFTFMTCTSSSKKSPVYRIQFVQYRIAKSYTNMNLICSDP